jgi:hypothetical protein
MLKSPFLLIALRVALVFLNMASLIILGMKLIWNSFSNDDLMVIMLVVLLGNVLLAIFSRKTKPTVL